MTVSDIVQPLMRRQLVNRLGINEQALKDRRQVFGVDDETLERLRDLKTLSDACMEHCVEGFYEYLLGHSGMRSYFSDAGQLDRVKKQQSHYFARLFDGECNIDYVEERLRVGHVHESIGLPLTYYVAAYRHYLGLVTEQMRSKMGDGDDFHQGREALEKLMHFDMSLAIDMYVTSHSETVARHQAAIREMSTPVIRVHERVLLLPLVGAVDSHRAQQIMETVLSRVVEEQAKVLILDIAGVAVVDTQVADYLLKATAAVQLLGAETILTGISAQVARTIVELGVEISTMDTRSRLADGIQLALSRVGKEIVDRGGAL